MFKRGMLVVVAVMFLSVPVLADISISGLSGAEHWAWYEAEDTVVDGGRIANQFNDSTGVSGWWFNPNSILNQYASGNFIEFNFDVPVAMSNAQIYFRYGNYSAKTSNVLLDGAVVDTFAMSGTSSWNYPSTIDNFATLGALTAGSHTVRLNHSDSYTERSFDGFMIYDGGNANIVNGTVNYGGPRYMNAPGSTNSPQLSAVTPVITGTGDGALILTLNGAPYVSGTPITEAGVYELKAIEKTGSNRVVTMAGANFEVVPEPATLLLLVVGGIGAIRRRK